MVRIRPNSLNGDLIAQVRTADKNYLIQMSNQQYLAAVSLADQLQVSINDFLLWLHVPGSGVEITGQSGSAAIEDVALARQASFRGIAVDQYVAELVLKGVAKDEANSAFFPATAKFSPAAISSDRF